MTLPGDQDLQNELAEALYGNTADEGLFACHYHPAEPAVGACRNCGAPLCEGCFSAAWPRMYCTACRSRLKQLNLFKTGLKSLKLPVIWVLICVVASGIAYAVGVGNPSLEKIAERDAKKPWFRHEAPQLLIAKGSRQQRRAAALRILNRNEQAKKWSEWSVEAFADAAELWKNTPVYNSIRVAEAKAVGDLGDYRRALAILEPLELEQKDPAYLARLYTIGLYYEKLGDKAKSLEWFNKAYDGAVLVSKKSFDNLIDRVTGDRNEAARVIKITSACNVLMDPSEIKKLLKDYDLPARRHDESGFSNFGGDVGNLKELQEKVEELKVKQKKREEKEPSFEVEKIE